MKAVKDLLSKKSIRLFLKRIGGSTAPTICEAIIKPVDDEVLAPKLNMKIADLRMILNKLHFKGVIDYNRSKDRDKGWYYYAWFVRPDKLVDAYLEEKKNELRDITIKLENWDAHAIYICRSCEQTYDFETASDNLFHCPLCDQILDRSDDEEDMKQLKNIKKRIEREIKEIEVFRKKFANLKYDTYKVL
ncbi:MAG: hypothetical protein ACTSVF_01340 [Candidatus Asgardarchaeia archaeon]